jgi:hypothetical protein
MVRHWWKERKSVRAWKRKFLINGIGLLLSGFILVSQLILKFGEGGWITVVITGSLVAVAVSVKRFYNRTHKRLKRLDHLMDITPGGEPADAGVLRAGAGPRFQPNAKTAVILVSGFNGTGLHTLLSIRKVFGDLFRNFVFIQAGIIDTDRFKGAEAIAALESHVDAGLVRYVSFLRSEGFHAEGVSAMGTDVADEVTELARKIFRKNPGSVFFGGQIVFPEETFLTRLLYNHTTFAVQRRLHQEGIPFLIMPVRVK